MSVTRSLTCLATAAAIPLAALAVVGCGGDGDDEAASAAPPAPRAPPNGWRPRQSFKPNEMREGVRPRDARFESGPARMTPGSRAVGAGRV
jgi:hypothetical protein